MAKVTHELPEAIRQYIMYCGATVVHTARRSNRLEGPMKSLDEWLAQARRLKIDLILFSRGLRSRNKVAVGEPSAGSLTLSSYKPNCELCFLCCKQVCLCVRVG